MRYVYDEEYDNLHQFCTNPTCRWRGGPHDEAFRNCPLCCHRLRIAEWAPDK